MSNHYQISCYFCEDEAAPASTCAAAERAANDVGFVIGLDADSGEAQYACSVCAEHLDEPVPLIVR